MKLCRCVVCNSPFEAKRNDAKYCPLCKKEARKLSCKRYNNENKEKRRSYAKEHYKVIGPRPKEKVKHEPRKCIFCGETFIPTRGDKVSCGKRTKEHRAHEKVLYVDSKCDICNKGVKKTAQVYRESIKKYGKIFCSRQCAMTGTGKSIKLECSECGNGFTRTMSEYNNYNKNGEYVFCSRKCQDKNLDYILRGKSHYWYIDGKSKNNRGKGWKRVRKAVRKRDKHTCQKCGITEETLGKKLDVHHITPYREFDDSGEANKSDNLISYCPSCHHKEENLIFKRKDEYK